ncbi:efflux RND transporter permease subunit, partial [Klebsiella pneumoniae]|nr:efflux RND transporter permease subunit [Klebsiella pneumoniae]
LASLLISLTLMPVLASFFLRHAREEETRVVRWLKARYRPILDRAISRPKVPAAAAAAFFLIVGALGTLLGAEFIPRLDEGSLAI